ncbi:MAG: hypothetical protein EHM20_04300 [Alphaproteobacteria bacterium]|nr:MAG: hypothetical protein EHM20_04300 [Alphaproteobacteria bacterium]
MAKNIKTLSLNNLRTELIKNCSNWLSRFNTIRIHLSVGEAAASKLQAITNQTALGSQPQNIQTVPNQESDVIILIQAALIQEWNIFLDSIFRDVVLFFLETCSVDRLPAARFDIKKIVPTNLSNLRESIASAVSESFSFKPYDQKTEDICSIFNVKDVLPLRSFLKKHVEIRNIFQHHRGVIRPSDLEKIGNNPFDILQEDKTKINYVSGDKIILTLSEINDLKKAIEDFSKKFEVLS